MTDTSTETVERFAMDLDGSIEPNNSGLWVRYYDYAALLAERDALQDKRDLAVRVIRRFIYETTSLSPVEDDGSHWCKISGECLEYGRTALTQLTKEDEG